MKRSKETFMDLREREQEEREMEKELEEYRLIKQNNNSICILERTEQQKEDEAAGYEYPL